MSMHTLFADQILQPINPSNLQCWSYCQLETDRQTDSLWIELSCIELIKHVTVYIRLEVLPGQDIEMTEVHRQLSFVVAHCQQLYTHTQAQHIITENLTAV